MTNSERLDWLTANVDQLQAENRRLRQLVCCAFVATLCVMVIVQSRGYGVGT